MAEKITSAKNCGRDTLILLFTSAITSAFAECRRELERLFTVPVEEEFTKIDTYGEEITKNVPYILQGQLNNLSEGIYKIKFKCGHNDKKCETSGIK